MSLTHTKVPRCPFSAKLFCSDLTNIPPGTVQQPIPVSATLRRQKLDDRFRYDDGEDEEEVEENGNSAIKALFRCLGVSRAPEIPLPLLFSSESYSGPCKMKFKLELEKNCHRHGSLAWLISKQ